MEFRLIDFGLLLGLDIVLEAFVSLGQQELFGIRELFVGD